MDCRLVGAKPLSEPMLVHCILLNRPLGTHSFEILIKINIFIQGNEFKMLSTKNGGHFVSASMC